MERSHSVEAGEVRYFTKSIAEHEALNAILCHEKILHTTALGPDTTLVVCVLEEHDSKVQTALRQWIPVVEQMRNVVLPKAYAF
jgi:hypothetical protein